MFRRYGLFDEASLWRSFDSMFRRALDETAGSTGRRSLPSTQGSAALAPATSPWMGAFYPAVECYTRDNHLVLRAELPGVDPKQVDVTVVGNQLVIRGEKQEEAQSADGNWVVQERQYGQFERVFNLPQDVQADQVKATFQNGILEVQLPVEALSTARKIPIEVAEGSKSKSVKAA